MARWWALLLVLGACGGAGGEERDAATGAADAATGTADAATGTSDGGGGAASTVMPGQPAVVAEAGAALAVPGGDHATAPFQVSLVVAEAGAATGAPPSSVVLGPVVTLRNDRAVDLPLHSAQGQPPFATVTLPFDPSKLPAGTVLDDLAATVRVRHETEGSLRLLGHVDAVARTVSVSLPVLPVRADLQVVHEPGLLVITDDVVPKLPVTQEPPWETTRVYLVIPSGHAKLKQIIKDLAGADDVMTMRTFLKREVSDRVTASAKSYEAMGLRQAELDVRALGGGARKLVVHLADFAGSSYHQGADFHLSQLQIDIDRLPDTLATPLGRVRASIHHELFHAVFAGYSVRGPTRGYNEGLATVLGVTDDREAATAQVRTANNGEIFLLDTPVGDNGAARYSNQDLLAYIARTVFAGKMTWLGGDEGLLERLAVARELQDDAATDETLRRAFAGALDELLVAHATSLAAVYDAFIVDRFAAHGAASQLRDGDTQAPGVALPDRFRAPVRATVSADGMSTVAVGPVPPFSSALLVVEAGGGYEKRLALDVELLSGKLADDGVRLRTYHGGGAGERWAGTSFVDGDFGGAHDTLYILITNTSATENAGLRFKLTAPSVKTEEDHLDFGFYRFQEARRGGQVLEVRDVPYDPDACDIPVGSSCTRTRRVALMYSTVEASVTVTHTAERDFLITATASVQTTAPTTAAGEGATVEAYISPSVGYAGIDFRKLAPTVECVGSGEVSMGGTGLFQAEMAVLLGNQVPVSECTRVRGPGLNSPWAVNATVPGSAKSQYVTWTTYIMARGGAAAGTAGNYAISNQATMTKLRIRYDVAP